MVCCYYLLLRDLKPLVPDFLGRMRDEVKAQHDRSDVSCLKPLIFQLT